MKVTKTKTLLETHKYKLNKDLMYVIEFKNGKEINRTLHTNKKINKYNLHPVYDATGDKRLLLKRWNPCWSSHPDGSNYNWFDYKNLPEPEKIDLKKVIYVQYSTHKFFDIDFNPEPTIVRGDYIQANLSNEYYDLEKLKQYLDKHPRVIKCSEILDIPYYNSSCECNKYLDVTVLPRKEDLKKMECNVDDVFGKFWDKKGIDYLGIKKFQSYRNH